MRRARAKEMQRAMSSAPKRMQLAMPSATKSAPIRQTNYPMLIKIVPSILIWYKIKKIPWGKYKNQEIKQSRDKKIKK